MTITPENKILVAAFIEGADGLKRRHGIKEKELVELIRRLRGKDGPEVWSVISFLTHGRQYVASWKESWRRFLRTNLISDEVKRDGRFS